MARGDLSGEGTLLDTLVVKITVDLSGFRAGIAQAVREVQGLKAAIVGSVGGVTLGDAMTAALVAPMIVATARIGQMRNELRLLTTEMRAMAALTYGPGGAGRNAGSLVPYAAGSLILNASERQGRTPGGQYSQRRWRIDGDESRDLREAAASRDLTSDAGWAAAMAASRQRFDERDPSREPAAGDDEAAPRGRRRRNWFQRTFSPTRSQRAFDVGRREFPGFGEAVENLGGNAHRVGAAGRRAVGSGIARTLGLVGLGSLFGDLIALATSLATVIGGTLAGAFAALATPLGVVVAAVTALVGLLVAANWDQFREFGEWFANRWRDIISGEGMGDVIAGWRNLTGAIRELWDTIKEAFHDDSNSIGAVLRFFGEVALRAINAVMELIGGFLNTLAELVRTVTALINGDWAGAWQHFSAAVETAFRTVLDTLGSLLPEIQRTLTTFGDWVIGKFRDIGDAIRNAFNQPPPSWLRAPLMGPGGMFSGQGAAQPHGGGSGFPGGLALSIDPQAVMAAIAAQQASGGGAGGGKTTGKELEKLQADMDRLNASADRFSAVMIDGFNQIARGGASVGDVLKQMVARLIETVVQMTILEPLAEQLTASMRAMFSGGSGGSKGGSGGGFWNAALQAVAAFFGGNFAAGGQLGAGQWGIAGENGPEVIYGGRTGVTVFPRGANDNGLHVDARAYIDARGADPAAIARLQAAIARRDAELPAKVAAYVGNMRQRGRL